MPDLNKTVNSLPIKKPKQTFPASHPFRHEGNHEKLLQWVKDKLDSDKQSRSNRCARYARIDRSVSGWITSYSDSDKERKKRQDTTGEPAVTKQNVSLIQVHLDDLASYFLDIFAPTRGIYYALGEPTKMPQANKMASLLSAHARKTERITQLNRFFTNAMKYNCGGLHTYWDEIRGTLVLNDVNGEAMMKTNEKIWDGNRVDSVDLYNFFYDQSVDILEVPRHGEWCAEAELKSHFELYRLNAIGKYTNYKDLLNISAGADTVYDYYKSPPKEAGMANQGDQKDTNFSDLWQGDGMGKRDSGAQIELVTMHAHINPKLFGLGTEDKYSIYKIVMAGGKRIIAATEMNNAHGLLPYSFARPLDDQMKGSQKAITEILTPLQDFASFCLNIHSEAVRTGIYGTRIFNSAYIDVNSIPEGEANAVIATKPGAKDVPMNNIATKLDSSVDTQQLMASFNMAFDIADSMFPAAQMPNQVAGIDRAIDSQVAAAVQGANKRSKKYGRVMVDQCLEISKMMQISNAQQFFRDGTVDEPNGEKTVITAEELREQDVTTQIGHGLMTLDRERMVGDLRDILFATFQSQAATEQLDVVAMLGAMLDMMDYHLDVEQFRLQPNPANPQGGQNVPDGINTTPGESGQPDITGAAEVNQTSTQPMA